MAKGEFAARKLEKNRKKWRLKESKYRKKVLGKGKKSDLMEGAPQAKGIVIEKRGVTARQPNSGIRKCVSPETLVYLADGCALEIGKMSYCWNSKEIECFDLNKREVSQSKLVDWFEARDYDKVFEIKTSETDRILRASGDHPIYSQRGKLELRELRVGDKVAVMPGEPVIFKESNKIVLTRKEIQENAEPRSKTEKIIRELEEKNLLPLQLDNPLMPKIVRLLGHLFGDGTLSWGKSGTGYSGKTIFSGKPSELKEIMRDVKAMGFRVSPIHKMYRKSIVEMKGKKHEIKGISYSMSCSSVSLYTLFKSLGVPVGDKASSIYRVPRWLRYSPLWVKEEFLSAYFGSELEKPRVNGKTFMPPSFNISKTISALKSGIQFAKDIENILKEFEVKVSKTTIKEYAKRKNGTKTFRILVYIKSNHKNLMKLFGRIGYKYNKERNALAKHAYQYLAIKRKLMEKEKNAFKEAMELRKLGLTIKEITKKLKQKGYASITRDRVNYWVSCGVREREKIGSTVKAEDFSEWIEKNTKGLGKSGLVWETIKEIKPIKKQVLVDITTQSNNHNFFANGFLTGNCVRVQLIKNGRQLTALAPRDKAIQFIDEHDEVTVEGLGGRKHGAKGDLWGVKFKVIAVNNQSLEMLRTGRKEKIKR